MVVNGSLPGFCNGSGYQKNPPTDPGPVAARGRRAYFWQLQKRAGSQLEMSAQQPGVISGDVPLTTQNHWAKLTRSSEKAGIKPIIG